MLSSAQPWSSLLRKRVETSSPVMCITRLLKPWRINFISAFKLGSILDARLKEQSLKRHEDKEVSDLDLV